MHNKSIAELSQGLASGEFSSAELTRVYLDRIEKHNAGLNALVSVTADEAMAAAQLADQTRQAGNAGLLTGVPLIHKDIFCTEGNAG